MMSDDEKPMQNARKQGGVGLEKTSIVSPVAQYTQPTLTKYCSSTGTSF